MYGVDAPTPAHITESSSIEFQAGQGSSTLLTRGWRSIALISWGGVIFGMTAAGITGRTVGKPPWWLGPSVDPAPIMYVLLITAITIAPFLVAITRSRFTPIVGIGASVLIAISGFIDLGDTPGVAVIQLAMAAAGAMASASLFAGLENNS